MHGRDAHATNMPSIADIFISAKKSFLSLLGGRSLWGFADQLLISFTNFATMILVARGLDDTARFGEFTLVYSAMLFANILQFALVTQPHNVLGTARKGEDYRLYTTATAAVQMWLALSLGAIATVVAFGAHFQHLPVTSQLVALVPSIVFWQLQEFIRRVMYTEGRMGGAFINDIISYGGQTILTALLFWRGGLTGAAALWALAITSAIACVVGFFQIRGSLIAKLSKAAILDNWHFGKWLLGSEILQWCSSLSMFLYIAAMILGTAASGTLRAAQILFGPARVFSFLLMTLLPIRFARALADEGEHSLFAQMRRAFGLVSLLLGPYCIVLAIFPKLILRIVFKPEYATEPYILSLYAGAAMMSYWLLVVTAALSARRMTRDIFFGSAVAGAVAMLTCWPLIHSMGMSGVIACMMLSTTAMAAFLVYRYRAALGPIVARDASPGTRVPGYDARAADRVSPVILKTQEQPCPS
jgi:O-antigen/teichoic acid export membrane protein